MKAFVRGLYDLAVVTVQAVVVTTGFMVIIGGIMYLLLQHSADWAD